MEMNWRVNAKKADFDGIAAEYGISPVIARVITNRGVSREDIGKYLYGKISDVRDPWSIADMKLGCNIMSNKIKADASIRVVGDYDVDGITSTYILYDGLRSLGANVSYDIPDRIRDGYGINVRIINDARRDNVDTIITCDNGISAFEAIALAKEYGMTVIVTDHHELKYELDDSGIKQYRWVDADAIIDIKRPDCPYPFKEICGATVAYKFLQCLYEVMCKPWGDSDRYIEFVAIATQCDIMSLTDENRIYVKRGLDVFPNTKNKGFQALIEAAGLSGKKLSSYHLGFVLGPCLNATGRLDSAKEALQLLLTDDGEMARKLAESVVLLNESRKQLTNEGVHAAEEWVDACDKLPDVLVVYLPDIHESIAGIIAGRIRERYYRPTYVLTKTENGILKGSGRSIKGYNMFDELTKCADLFLGYGGHELAAGFSLVEDNLESMREALNRLHTMTEEVLTPKLMIDVPMPMSYPDAELVEQLALLEPYGKDNEKPVFAESQIGVVNARLIGSEGQYIRLTFKDRYGNRINGIDFNANNFISCIKLWFGEQECDKMFNGEPNDILIDVAYTPDVNEYNGRITMQVKPTHYRKSL